MNTDNLLLEGYLDQLREAKLIEFEPDDSIPSIYFLFDNYESSGKSWQNGLGNVVYIGSTIRSPNTRIGTHRNNKKFTSWKIISITDIDNLHNIEADLIVHFDPKYNFDLPQNDYYLISSQVLDYCKSKGLIERKRAIFKSMRPVYMDYYSINHIDRIINKLLDEI